MSCLGLRDICNSAREGQVSKGDETAPETNRKRPKQLSMLKGIIESLMEPQCRIASHEPRVTSKKC